jgi:hypothetical protein
MSATETDARDAQIESLTLERDRQRERIEQLEDFAERVYDLTAATQPEIAYKTCQTLLTLARQSRAYECPEGCEGPHYVERWAAIKNVSARTIYRWMDEGNLKFTRSEKVRGVGEQFKRRMISHAQMEAFEACQ